MPETESDHELVDALFAFSQDAPISESQRGRIAGLAGVELDRAEELQLAVLDLWEQRGVELGGWKVGLTSLAARDSMGPGYRPFGFVLEPRVLASGAKLEASARSYVAEVEICLVLGQDLKGADIGPYEARDAVAGIAASFEICAPRVPREAPTAVKVATGINNWGIVIGPSRSPGDIVIDELEVTFVADGEVLQIGRSSADVVDDPYLSLARLCRRLAAHGRGLARGQRVITGTLIVPTTIGSFSEIRADFDQLGSVSLAIGS